MSTSPNDYPISEYISAVRELASNESDPQKLTAVIKPLSQRLAASRALQDEAFRVCDEEQGFGVHLLHEEDNHDLGVFVFCWLPDRGTPPHNHKTWAVVSVVEGEEYETHWQRNDDGSQAGYAELEQTGAEVMNLGDTSVCMPEDIHGVWNRGATPSVSLHTYGRHINYTGRSYFEPDTNTETPYLVTVEGQNFHPILTRRNPSLLRSD